MVALLATSSANAASISYYLDQSNKLADGINYLQVTIDDEGEAGVINFTVTALAPLLELAGDNFGIQKFAFNILGGIGAEAKDVDALPENWRARNGGRMDGFGLFDVKLQGKGKNRQDPLTFSIAGVDLDTITSYVDLSTGRAPQGFSLFSAHVAGFNFGECGIEYDGGGDGKSDPLGSKAKPKTKKDDCVTSAFFGGNTAVPAPPAVWLLGTAVAGLVGRRFLKRAE
jgi:hypothetical protein